MDARLAKEIFQRYDIRGRYPEQMTPRVAYLVGRAFVDYYGFARTKIAVGQDMRLSSPELAKNFIRGAQEQGADILDLGQASSPMVHYAINRDKLAGGAVISASHAAKEINGIKLITHDTLPVNLETGLAEIRDSVISEQFTNPVTSGTYETHSIMREYIDHTLKLANTEGILQGIRVVVDTGNGMAGLWIRDLLSRLKVEIIPLYLELNGNFPNHPADPMREVNLADLKKNVVSEKAAFGVAFDGDADQVIFVDETGAAVRPDYITGLLAMGLLAKEPGGIVLYDVRSSYVVRDAVLSSNGKVLRCPVSHGAVKKMMKDHHALFAGGVSGHYFFRVDNNQINPALALIEVLRIVSRTRAKLSRLLHPFSAYVQSGELYTETTNPAGMLKSLAAKYQLGNISTLDGLSVEFDDWWFNARPAADGHHLRINIEGKNEEVLRRKTDEILHLVRL